MISGLIELKDANAIVQGLIYPSYVWEFDFYIGIIGAFFLAFFGIYQWLKKPIISIRFLVPIIGLVFLSLGNVFEIFHWSFLPLFYGERVTSRLFSLPLVFLILLAGAHCQNWLNEQKRSPVLHGVLLIGLVFLGADLWSHFQLWDIGSLTRLFDNQLHQFNPSTWVQVNYVDSLYTGMLRRGLIISTLSLVMALAMAWINPVEGFSFRLIQGLFLRLHICKPQGK